MIKLTRLNGTEYWLNPHQIETIESKPDTTITLLSGKKLVVLEKPEQLVESIVGYRRLLGQLGNEN